MAQNGWLSPLHSGPHDSVGDLTPSDYVILLLILGVLVGIGFMIFRFVQRRRDDDFDD